MYKNNFTVSVMTIAVLQYESRQDHRLQNLMERNKNICKKTTHFTYIRWTSCENNSIPCYWMKVKIVKQLLEDNTFDGVLWLDSDAVIHDSNRLHDLICNTRTFLMSNDIPFISTFNAGVWYVRNNIVGKKL